MRSPVFLLLVTLTLSLAWACSGRPVDGDRAGVPGTVSQPGTRLLIAEQRGGLTEFWSIDPGEPASRQPVAAVSHNAAWGVRASLSPDQRLLAVTAMPAGARDPDREARLLLIDRASHRERVLLRGVDLRITPLWAGRDAVIAGRADGGGELVLADLGGRSHRISAAGVGNRVHPAAASPDGSRLYIARFEGNATTIETVSRAGRTLNRAAIGSGPARAFTLSADGRRLAFLQLQASVDGQRYRAATLDLERATLTPAWPEHDRVEDTGLAWRGDTLAGSAVGPHGASLLPAAPTSLQPRATGFDALVAASPDGRWLAVRGFEDGTPAQPGRERLDLIGADGRRLTASERGAAVIGWLA